MAVTLDILKGWRAPRALIRQKLGQGVREDRALAVLMGACLLFFVAQWPRLSREAFLHPEVPLDARMGGALLGWVFIAPLLFYAVGAASHLVAKVLGGKGTWFSARLALFWALLVVSPLVLLNGLVAGFIGDGPGATVVGVLVLLGFLYLWLSMLIEAEREWN
jgi:hypothetical protein